METIDILRKVGFFEGISDEDLLKINSIVEKHNLGVNEIIFSENAPGGEMFIILTGKIRIYRTDVSGSPKVLALLDPGQIFGELSIFDHLPRSATAIATEPTELLSIKAEKLNNLLNQDKTLGLVLLQQVIKNISVRLRQTNDRLQDRILWGFTAKL